MRSKAIGEFWLSQDPKSPNWCRTWYEAGSRQTKRVSLGTADQEEAFARLAEWYVLNRRLEREQPRNVPLAVILDRYLSEHAKDSPAEGQAKIALRNWKNFYGDDLVSELTVIRQEAFIASLRARKFSDGYIARTITVGKAALNRAKKRQELAEVPHILTVTSHKERGRVLSLEEAQALWKAVDSSHVAMYLTLAFNTAARPDAILDLTAGQIDCERRIVRLNPDGRKQTKKYRPILPLTNDLEAAVNGLSGPLVNWRGKRVANIKTGFRALRRRARLDADVIPYTIRHTMATELRASGVSPWEVAGWLGHKIAEVRTTERYAKASPDYLANARNAVDAYMVKLRSFQRSSNADAEKTA